MSTARYRSERDAPIGVFDSGIGGLSVLQALQAALPGEDYVYVADSAYTPYGERSHELIAARSGAIAEHLRDAHGAKLLVMACNTASAAAAHAVRYANPGWPVVAIEPALKPAALHTRSGRVGVLATRSTLASAKFASLRQSMAASHPQVQFAEVACDGLAAAIEHWALTGDGEGSRALVQRYLSALGPMGEAAGQVDTVVLGCTHYPLIRDQIPQGLPTSVLLVDSGAPVARHVQRLLHSTGLLRFALTDGVAPPSGALRLLATGSTERLQAAARRWLTAHDAPLAVCALAL